MSSFRAPDRSGSDGSVPDAEIAPDVGERPGQNELTHREIEEPPRLGFVAAVNDGKTTLMLTRYNDDNNTCNIATVNILVKYTPGEVVYCHLTDDRHNYTEIPLFPADDGSVSVKLSNNSIAIVEF